MPRTGCPIHPAGGPASDLFDPHREQLHRAAHNDTRVNLGAAALCTPPVKVHLVDKAVTTDHGCSWSNDPAWAVLLDELCIAHNIEAFALSPAQLQIHLSCESVGHCNDENVEALRLALRAYLLLFRHNHMSRPDAC